TRDAGDGAGRLSRAQLSPRHVHQRDEDVLEPGASPLPSALRRGLPRAVLSATLWGLASPHDVAGIPATAAAAGIPRGMRDDRRQLPLPRDRVREPPSGDPADRGPPLANRRRRRRRVDAAGRRGLALAPRMALALSRADGLAQGRRDAVEGAPDRGRRRAAAGGLDP